MQKRPGQALPGSRARARAGSQPGPGRLSLEVSSATCRWQSRQWSPGGGAGASVTAAQAVPAMDGAGRAAGPGGRDSKRPVSLCHSGCGGGGGGRGGGRTLAPGRAAVTAAHGGHGGPGPAGPAAAARPRRSPSLARRARARGFTVKLSTRRCSHSNSSSRPAFTSAVTMLVFTLPTRSRFSLSQSARRPRP